MRMGMLRVPHRHGFRGMGDASTILSNEQFWSTNPYLTSPAFLASQAASLQKDCAAAPNDPACQIATVTGDLTKGYNPVADTTLNLSDYCSQNLFNNGMFATPLDTAACSGGKPVQSLLTQAATIAAASPLNQPPQAQPVNVVSGGGSGTQGGGGSVLTVAPKPPAPAPSPSPSPAPTPPPGADSLSVLSTSTTAWLQANWILVAAGVGAIILLPSLMGGKH